MAKIPINDPKHWRDRGEEARTVAEEMTDPDAKRKMLRIAEDYEELRGVPKSGCWQPKIQSKAEPTHWVARSPTVTSKAEEYRQHAEECLAAASRIQNAEDRAILLNIAQTG